jgi:hypothetical protein
VKPQYKRDLDKEYFRSLQSYNYSPVFDTPNPGLKILIDKINSIYKIPRGNINRLLQYTEIALNYALESELKFYNSDRLEFEKFENDQFPISTVEFKGWQKGSRFPKKFEISNPYLIDKLYRIAFEYAILETEIINSNIDQKKKRSSATLLKKVATQLFNELKRDINISEWQSLCIIGHIYAFYGVGLKKGEPIKTEEAWSLSIKDKEKLGQTITESYLQYLASRIKRYIIK